MYILDKGLLNIEKKNLYEGSENVMLWHYKSDPRFSYYVDIPESISKKEKHAHKIVCIIHALLEKLKAIDELIENSLVITT